LRTRLHFCGETACSDDSSAPTRRVLTSTNTSHSSSQTVELAEAGAVVGRDDLEAEALEVLAGKALADAAQVVAQIDDHRRAR